MPTTPQPGFTKFSALNELPHYYITSDGAADAIGEPNRFATEAEAREAIESLRSLGTDWADRDYQVERFEPDPAPIADELYETLRGLVPDPDRINVLDNSDDPDAPEAWAVWIDLDDSGEPSFQDIIGAGATRTEALADAVATVRGWANG
jgi:hypothetical protein